MTASEKINILMVDDQPSKLLSYEAILDELGENLIRATTGQEALAELLKHDIAIVLMDVSMPEMDGFELAAMIRQHPRYQKTAIIFISAVRHTDFDRLKGYEVGAVDYIPIPVVPELLRAKVSVFADLYRKTRQLEELNQELERRVEERTAELEATAAREREARQEAEAALVRTQVSETRFRLLVEANIIGIVVSDGEHVIEANDAFLQMVGCSRNDLLASGVSRVKVTSPAHCRVTRRAFKEAHLHGACAPFEKEYIRPDGTCVPVLVGIVRLESEPARFVSFVVDLTERKQLEREREAARANELAALEVNQHLDQFFATAAHDIRTPVTAALGSMELAQQRFNRLVAQALAPATGQDRTGSDPVAGVRASLELANQSMVRLADLTGRLFDVAHARSGALAVDQQPCDLAVLVRAQVEAECLAAPKRLVRLDVPEQPVPVLADADRVGQVLANYLTNALKYSAADRPVEVRLEVVGDVVRVAVCDHGPGLPPEECERVWAPFYRVPGIEVQNGAVGTSGSLGLGLSIGKTIIERHGGQVGVQSAVGEGSTFWFSLPLTHSAT